MTYSLGDKCYLPNFEFEIGVTIFGHKKFQLIQPLIGNENVNWRFNKYFKDAIFDFTALASILCMNEQQQ